MNLERRVLEISYKYRLSHISSCLTALPIIFDIYSRMHPEDRFILSSGHAHVAHAVVMEQFHHIKDAEENIQKYGIHCDRKGGCYASTGSLGHGIGIAVGMALADRHSQVYCILSDGETEEGSVWEALRIAQEQHLANLHVYCNANSWAAYKRINVGWLKDKIREFGFPVKVIETDMSRFPKFLQGQIGHYKILTKEEYKEALRSLSY